LAWSKAQTLGLAAGGLAALAGWDLSGFARRMRRAGRVQGEAELVSRHLRRLGIVVGLGAALILAALLLPLRLGFGAALLLGVLVVVGLARVIRGAGNPVIR
jgi:hypothetical protein